MFVGFLKQMPLSIFFAMEQIGKCDCTFDICVTLSKCD